MIPLDQHAPQNIILGRKKLRPVGKLELLRAGIRAADNCKVDQLAVVGHGSSLGPDVRIYPRCRVGCNVAFGAKVLLRHDVTVGDSTAIGERSQIWQGSRIGSQAEIEGRTIVSTEASIGDRVKVGTRCKIGRYAVIGADVEIQDNCEIGEHVHLEAGVTIGRGSVLHDHVYVGGRSFIGAKTMIGDLSRIGQRAHIGSDVRIAKGINIAQEVALDDGTFWSINPLAINGSRGMAYVPKAGFMVVLGTRLNIEQWLIRADELLPLAIGSDPSVVREYKAYLEVAYYWMTLHGYMPSPFTM